MPPVSFSLSPGYCGPGLLAMTTGLSIGTGKRKRKGGHMEFSVGLQKPWPWH